ncbi:GntR family transcriptional regulator [Rhodoferax sp.]|uniref:GntR family transcriptional regulator n=1 Tax=Rhodoferax sp. TaxID=50421 RepID=UPI00374D7871
MPSNLPIDPPLADVSEKSDDGQPRYVKVARELKRAIAAGVYPVGAHLPTEHQLCEQFQVSRFTAREAVRILAASGLVTRRPRIGTVVAATSDAGRYTHNATSVQDLLQYAQDTELRLVYIGKVAFSKAQAQEFAVDAGVEWVYGMGVRMAGTLAEQAAGVARPICVTRLYLNPVLVGIETRLRGRRGAVHAMIEADYGVAISRVEQELQGVLLDADDAANLDAVPGAAGLRIVRRYYSDKDELLEIADNVHASDRFSYKMQMRM